MCERLVQLVCVANPAAAQVTQITSLTLLTLTRASFKFVVLAAVFTYGRFSLELRNAETPASDSCSFTLTRDSQLGSVTAG